VVSGEVGVKEIDRPIAKLQFTQRNSGRTGHWQQRDFGQMKLRHAVALALVGWYLMVPPFPKSGHRYEPDPSVPLSQWSRRASFDSVAECEAHKTKWLDSLKKNTEDVSPAEAQAIAKAVLLSECIATDDPRLKSK
jgi:hypothetical protein